MLRGSNQVLLIIDGQKIIKYCSGIRVLAAE
jgi:hypothetical protein